jgi:hypothetical protein
MKYNMKYKSTNGINMLKCFPLSWEICKTYAIECQPNPEFYIIVVGSIDDMWQATLIPETMILSFCSVHYSANEVYRFKVESVEEASELVLKFAKGMNRIDDLINTIYWNPVLTTK